MLKSNDLINKVKSYNKFLNPETLDKAYNFAVKAHENQKRHSGDPYVIHPVAVANILTELKLDSATIATGLLHDTIEDTHATYQTIKQEFGQEVADLVEGVTKISELENQAKANSRPPVKQWPRIFAIVGCGSCSRASTVSGSKCLEGACSFEEIAPKS